MQLRRAASACFRRGGQACAVRVACTMWRTPTAGWTTFGRLCTGMTNNRRYVMRRVQLLQARCALHIEAVNMGTLMSLETAYEAWHHISAGASVSLALKAPPKGGITNIAKNVASPPSTSPPINCTIFGIYPRKLEAAQHQRAAEIMG